VGELMDIPETKGKSALWNERTRETEKRALQNWIDDGRQSERVKQSLLFVFFFSILFLFFLSLRMLHEGRVAMAVAGLKGRMEVCVCLKRANLRSPLHSLPGIEQMRAKMFLVWF
jgi:hypothetical protein